MSANPSGSNPFATNYSGGGVGLRTADPAASIGTSQMMQPGQYTSYQTPPWISSGLSQSIMPIQNYPVQNYGRWNWNNGAYNGQGMSASGWPNPQSITSPYGMPQGGGFFGGGQQMYGAPGGVPQFPGGTGGQMAGAGGFTASGTDQRFKSQAGLDRYTQNQAMQTALRDPAQVQSAAASFAQMDPAMQAQYLQNNPQMQAALVKQGLLSNSTINNLLGGSIYQSQSGQPLKAY
jgi:hypothetical protein